MTSSGPAADEAAVRVPPRMDAEDPLTAGDPVDYDSRAFFRRLGRRAMVVDLIVAAAFLTVCLASSARNDMSIVPALLMSAGLANRRMSPLLAIALCWAAAILQLILGVQPYLADLAVLGVLYGMAAYGNRLTRWVGIGSAFAGALVASVYLSGPAGDDVSQIHSSNPGFRFVLQAAVLFVVFFVLFGFFWVLGLLARSRRMARASVRARLVSEFERRRAQELVVVEQQRTRIARDMHDVVAHSLAVVIAQADGVRYGHAAEPALVEETLRTISATARAALGDVRQLLAELRDGDNGGPQPRIADLDRLIEQLRAVGLDVRFDEMGARFPQSPGHQIAFFRIVQEALTNALRHGDAARPVTVTCRWDDDLVELTVINSLRESAEPEPDRALAADRVGHGLPGMRERAVLAGGTFHASAEAGEFCVRAVLPRAVVEDSEASG